MTASPRESSAQASPANRSSVQHWLDALVAKSCTQDDFLLQMDRLLADDPDVAWEILALLDQYARRKLISPEVLASLKAPLQQSSLGISNGRAPSPPPVARVVPPQTPREPLQAGSVLCGRYRVVDIRDQKGSGTLIEAVDELRVNIAGVSPRRAIQVRETSQLEPELLQRMCSLQALSHPGIERVFDVVTEPGAAFLVTEWLTGMSLHQLLEQNGGATLAPPAAQTIIRTLASALAYAHSRDVWHGDLRAENVFITDAGEIRLRGFDIGGDWLANPRSDRLAFARLTYELLSGSPWEGARLREPRGLAPAQWRVLRDTLLGREGPGADVLAAFAGSGDVASGRVFLPQAFARTTVNRRVLSSVMASVVVAALLAGAGYLLVTQNATSPAHTEAVPPAAAATRAESLPAVAEAPAPAVPSPDEAAPDETASEVATRADAPPSAISPVPPAHRQRAEVDLPADTLDVRGDQPVARIWVRRRGGLSGAVTFWWWTETGSAKADQDFGAAGPQLAEIPDGAQGIALMVPLVSDPSRRESRTFYVKIDEPGQDAVLGDRTLVQVRIVPPDST